MNNFTLSAVVAILAVLLTDWAHVRWFNFLDKTCALWSSLTDKNVSLSKPTDVKI